MRYVILIKKNNVLKIAFSAMVNINDISHSSYKVDYPHFDRHRYSLIGLPTLRWTPNLACARPLQMLQGSSRLGGGEVHGSK